VEDVSGLVGVVERTAMPRPLERDVDLGIVENPSDITSEEEGGEETTGLVLDGGWYLPLPRSGILRSRRPEPLVGSWDMAPG